MPGGTACRAAGGAERSACPRHPRLTLWFAVSGGVLVPCRLRFVPTLHKPFAPIPPTPFPSGEGGAFCYLMQGASPLATPSLRRKVCWLTGGFRYRKGLAPRHRVSGRLMVSLRNTGEAFLPLHQKFSDFHREGTRLVPLKIFRFLPGRGQPRRVGGSGGDGTIRR